MKVLMLVSKFIDRITELLGKVAMWASLILLCVIVFEVVSRRFFNNPTIWTYETSTMLFGFFILMIIPYGMLHKVNVFVDVIFERFSPKTQKIITLLTYLIFFFPFVIGLFFAGVKFAQTSWLTNERSWSTWAPYLYPIKTCIPIAFFLTFMQGISEFIKQLKGNN